MARELTNLGLAWALPPLSNKGTYIVSPIAPIHALSSQSRTFKSRFPDGPSLPTLLSAISCSPEPCRWDRFQSEFGLDPTVLPFLMRQGWLIPLREFYFIRVPREIKVGCIEAVDRVSAERETEDSILVDPYRASSEEVRWIKKIAEEVGKNGDEVSARIFVRLAKYFDGKSSKEKILRKEQVERSELEGMIEAVRKVGGVIIAEHW
jgi:nitrogen permease regulator 3-like protein